MELGIVGLGRMGANMARRLMRDGHKIVAYDVNPGAIAALAGDLEQQRAVAEARVRFPPNPISNI